MRSMFTLDSISSFYVAGQRREVQGLPLQQRVFAQGSEARSVDINGDHMLGQAYVQVYKQAAAQTPWPVMLWHGGGMTGANWEATPDGREGWLQLFLQNGWDVCIADAMERGRASWAIWPHLYAEPPLMRSMQEGWDMFRIGSPSGYASQSSLRQPHAGQMFPAEYFDRFACQWVPRWIGHEDLIMSAYEQMLDQVGPCVLIGHSQGGGFALKAAAMWPEKIKAVVALEPSGAPEATIAVSQVTQVPHLIVWGDHFEQHPQWQRYRHTVMSYCEALRVQGVSVDQLLLADVGLAGHSHFPMLDRNSEAVYEKVSEWLLDVTRC
jgi:pimeloyl-ACP methyl ester carboxylesterase